VNLFAAGYEPPRARAFEDELLDRVQAVSGVQGAAYSRITPFSYRTYSSAPIAVEGYDTAPDEQPSAEYNEVGPGYFATLRIPLVAGRDFTRADDEGAPLVAIVDETLAVRYWRGGGPARPGLKVRGGWVAVVVGWH